MKIALVFPKSTFLNDPKVWPPLGLMYLSAQLMNLGHTTDFFDLNFRDMPRDGEFDQLWVSSTSPQIAEARRIGKETSKWVRTKTVLGGAGAWANPESHKNLGYNLVVCGEADHPDTIREILFTAESCDRDTVIYPKVSKDLSWVLPPDRRWALDYTSYMKHNGKSYRMASLFTTRGCPMNCAFCESGRHGVIWDRFVRYEPLEVVEAQIKECQELGFTGLAYYDDIFILNRKRTSKLLELHKKYGMVFRCFLRSDILSNQGGFEYLQELRDGGLIEIFVGVESANNQIKKNIHKGTTIEQDTNVLEWCNRLGITCKMSFILGLPGETLESMEDTRRWILEHRPSRVQVDRLIPFTGTPLVDHPEDYDLQYVRQPDEEWFFKGRMDIDTKSFVSTTALSVEQIDIFWKNLNKELEDLGIGT